MGKRDAKVSIRQVAQVGRGPSGALAVAIDSSSLSFDTVQARAGCWLVRRKTELIPSVAVRSRDVELEAERKLPR